MNIAICDDSNEYILLVKNYVERLNDDRLEYDIYNDGESLLTAIKCGGVYDAIFLDMEMGKLGGIETADLIRQINKYVIIVFVTSYSKYMQQSFRCMPFRFLIKPLRFEDFKTVCEEIRIKLNNEPQAFMFLENKIRTRIFCSDIIFFESSAHSILIYMRNGHIHKVRKSMTELLDAVRESSFVRVHKGFVVNLFYIYKISETKIILHNYDRPIPIGRTYLNDFEEAFLNFKERKYLL